MQENIEIFILQKRKNYIKIVEIPDFAAAKIIFKFVKYHYDHM